MEGPGVLGPFGAGVSLSPILKAFEQVERMLLEFSSFAYVLGQLFQDFRTAAAGLQAEHALSKHNALSSKSCLGNQGGKKTVSQPTEMVRVLWMLYAPSFVPYGWRWKS